MKRICWLLICMPIIGMEHTIDIPHVKSTTDLLNEDNLKRAISNYFKTHDAELCNHIAEPLRRKIEESSGEGLEKTTAYARDSIDMERLTQSLITDLLKEALREKRDNDSGVESTSKNNSKQLLYVAAAGAITTLTGVLVTYFTKT